MSTNPRRARRHDPDRKETIIETATVLISAEGLAQLSHRKIATAADVPLGSITYHFPTLDELVIEVFERYTSKCSDRFQRALSATRSVKELPKALAAEVSCYLKSGSELALAYELYLGCIRNPRLKAILTQWLLRSRGSLAMYFDADTARVIDALIEGLILHTLHEETPLTEAQLEEAFRRVIRGQTVGKSS